MPSPANSTQSQASASTYSPNLNNSILEATHLSWATPQNKTIFSDISFAIGREKVALIGDNGIGKSSILEVLSGQRHAQQGAVTVHGSIAYLPQKLRFDHTNTVADILNITPYFNARDQLENGNCDPKLFELMEGQWDFEERARAIMDRLGLIDVDLKQAKTELSGGQLQRIGLCSVFLQQPDLIILDEPGNSLDQQSRAYLYSLIKDWKAGLLVVSHDRVLLNLVDRCLELSRVGIREYGGNYDHFKATRASEIEAATSEIAGANERLKRAKMTAQRARERYQRRSSKGKASRKDGSQPKTVLDVRKARSERTNKRLLNQQQLKLDRLRADLKTARDKAEWQEEIKLILPRPNCKPGRNLLRCTGVCFEFANSAFALSSFNLEISGGDRIHLAGENGSGKSTLVGLITDQLQPSSGLIWRAQTRIATLDQRAANLDRELTLLENLRLAAPKAELQTLRWILGRFLFSDHTVNSPVKVLSGGETMRAALACILVADEPPGLLILDEPTNNLDIKSVSQMTQALNLFEGSLLVISHDQTFINELNLTQHWRMLQTRDQKSSQLKKLTSPI